MALSTERLNTVLAICQSLVQIPSLSGQEKPVIERTAQWMRDLGYDEVLIDECGNLLGVLKGSEGPTILFDSHVDTVAAEDASAWHYGPHSGVVADNRIWGRGTSDMKGALASSLAGLAFARQDNTLRGTVLVSASVGEEIIEGLALTRMIPMRKPDLVVICEATALKVATAGRGRAELTVTTQGKSAHASTPKLGINAARQMSRLLLAMDEIEPRTDPRLGQGILEPTELITSPFPSVSVVPWQCRARYDRRLLVGETEADILEPLQAVINRLAEQDPTFRADVTLDIGSFTCYTGLTLSQKKINPAWLLPDDDHWVKAMRDALQNAHQAASIGHYNFCTNGSYTAGTMHIPTIGYGPGFETSAHITNEYLDLEQLFGAANGYYAMASMQPA